VVVVVDAGVEEDEDEDGKGGAADGAELFESVTEERKAWNSASASSSREAGCFAGRCDGVAVRWEISSRAVALSEDEEDDNGCEVCEEDVLLLNPSGLLEELHHHPMLCN
jgi:hypothetical protein